MGFEKLLRLMQAGDPLQAAKVRAPLQTLDANVNYLYQWLQAAGVGATVYWHRQTLDPTVQVGTPVWWNPTTAQFEAGLALVESDASSGILMTSPRAQIWGIVANKIYANLGDILLYGVAEIDISAAVAGPVTAGTYYLSGTAQGLLTQQKPPVSVPVLRTTGDGHVFVMPQFVDFLDRHVHYRFPLTCLPAGTTTPPAPGEIHVLTNGDPTMPGWLPASDASFGGKAPRGAVFGYNLKHDASLYNAWPPIPAGNAYLDLDRGLDPAIGATGVPLGPDGLCILDQNGIWWMSNCYGDVPWPTDTDTTVSASMSASISDNGLPECPRDLQMRMTLWFTRVSFDTDDTAVLSLRSRDPRIKVYCAGTNAPAATGNLELVLDLALSLATGALGYTAIKCFNPKTGQFKSGPVIEGVYALSPGIQFSGDVVTNRTINGVVYQVYQGLVGISVSPAETLELEVGLVKLGGVTEENFQGSLYLGFIEDEDRQYTARIEVPTTLTLPNPQMALRFVILGRAAGTLPQLLFTVLRVPRPPAGLNTPLTLPDESDAVSLTCDTVVTLDDDNQYVEVTSTPFTVAAGDTVFFTVERDGTDVYSAEVGILRQAGIVSTTPAS